METITAKMPRTLASTPIASAWMRSTPATPVNTDGIRSMSNIKVTPLNQQRQAASIPASRHSTRSSLEMGTNGSMCMAVHNTIEHSAVCQRLSHVTQDGFIHVHAEFWDKFGTTMGQICFEST
ncbi:MAG TPA: hypothetical protein PKH05_18905 [Nitrospira sp.]|nr:hypothetical protein [Burkholderiaceae bacterium]HNK07448.1 hypothetical protein [Giesbergeria sp.]HNL91159.1 hypothetical protein [Nitrospira sp.]HNO43291.1 hypothetical protein [Ottowia sp.]HQO53416.1 hypothetical protein [Ottowia sp.]